MSTPHPFRSPSATRLAGREAELCDALYAAMLRHEAHLPDSRSRLGSALGDCWRYSSLQGLVHQPDHPFTLWLARITPLCLAQMEPGPPLSQLARQTPTPRKDLPMEVTTRHLDGVRFSIETRGHTILTDQPTENGGQDTAMTPPELLLASLSSCAAFYAAQYLKTRNLVPAEGSNGLIVTVTAEKLKPPARIGNFVIRVQCPVPLTADQQEAMMRSVHQCVVHNTLTSQPEIAIQITTA